MAGVQTAHSISSKLRTGDVLINENVDFPGLLLSEPVLKGLSKAGFQRPSPIQLKAIPIGRCGLDLIVQAKSGTGKTCVFTVISLESLSLAASGIQVLVLAPTREIAIQIWEVVTSIGSEISNLKCHTFIGGLPLNEDRAKLKKCHIGIGTPGRVMQLIETGAMSTESIRLFVLDEADKLLEENFQEQINWIYSTLPENKQMIALSATYPEVLAQHLTKYMRDPVFVRLNSSDPALLGIKQFYKTVPYHPIPHKAFDSKVAHFLTLLSSVSFNQCLVFSNYQTRAQMLSDILNSKGWPSTYISGSQDQQHRMQAMAQLKKYQCRILISTDLTSRGIDAENVNLVVNLDLPFDHETYLHRIGRAGRFGTFGAGVTYVCTGAEEKKLHQIEDLCNTVIQPLPDALPVDLTKSTGFVNFENLVTTEKLVQPNAVGREHVSETHCTSTVSENMIEESDGPTDPEPMSLLNNDAQKESACEVLHDVLNDNVIRQPLVAETVPANDHISTSQNELSDESPKLDIDINIHDLQQEIDGCNDLLETPIQDFHIPALAEIEVRKENVKSLTYAGLIDDYLAYMADRSCGSHDNYEPLGYELNEELIEDDLIMSVSQYLKSLTFNDLCRDDQNDDCVFSIGFCEIDVEKGARDSTYDTTYDISENQENVNKTDQKMSVSSVANGTRKMMNQALIDKMTNAADKGQFVNKKSSGTMQTNVRDTKKRQPRFNPMSVSLLLKNRELLEYNEEKMLGNDSPYIMEGNKRQSKSENKISTEDVEFSDSKESMNLSKLRIKSNDVFRNQRIKSDAMKRRPDLFQPLHVDTQRPLEDDLTDVSTLVSSSVSVTDSDSQSSDNSDSVTSSSLDHSQMCDDENDKVGADYEGSVFSFYSDQSFTDYSEDESDSDVDDINHENIVHGYHSHDHHHSGQLPMWYYYQNAISAYNMYNYYAWQSYAGWMGAYYASAYIDQFHRSRRSKNDQRYDWNNKLSNAYYSQAQYFNRR